MISPLAPSLLRRRVCCGAVWYTQLGYFAPIVARPLTRVLVLEQLGQSKIEDLDLT